MRTSSSGLIVVPVCCKSQFLPTNPPTLLQTQISPSTPIHGKCTSRCRYYAKYKHKPPTAQDVFQPISGFISSAGVTGKCRMLSHVSWTKCSQVADPYGTYTFISRCWTTLSTFGRKFLNTGSSLMQLWVLNACHTSTEVRHSSCTHKQTQNSVTPYHAAIVEINTDLQSGQLSTAREGRNLLNYILT